MDRQMLYQALIVLASYMVTLSLSGIIVRLFVGPFSPKENSQEEKPISRHRLSIGTIIGKCENLIVVTFILAGAYTGLALIFTAKSIVRSEDMKKDPRYYLGGTLVNFVFSMLIGFGARLALQLVGALSLSS